MKPFTFEFIDKLSVQDEEKMSEGFITYEMLHGVAVNYKKFSLVLKNVNSQTIGILNAFAAFAEIYIDDLWIESSFRDQGLGRQLLKKLENHFEGQGYNNINLVTNAFQAPEFYKKCGYQVEFIRENKKNPKLTKIFFIKYFENEVQTQGILKI